MRTTLAIVGTTALVVVAVFASPRIWSTPASSAATAKQANFLLLPPAAPAGQMVLYGHVKKLTPTGGHYLLGFDPAWFTSGITASRAHKEDTGSSEVPNDNYTVEEGHRLLWYILPSGARITVLTNQGTKGISATPISAAELSRIVNGGPHRKLYEPLDSGVWIRVRIDTVKELDQQYKP
jgi:hypothetical protein